MPRRAVRAQWTGDDDERQTPQGARQACRRCPVSARSAGRSAGPSGGEEFDLFYARTGRKSEHPLVIIPGGPGAASVALYRGLAAPRGRRWPRRHHGRTPRRGYVAARRRRCRSAAGGADHRRGRRRHRRGARRRPRGVRRWSTARRTAPIWPPGSACAIPAACTRWSWIRRCSPPTTSMRCARPPGGCCGTATTPTPPSWRPRCAAWSRTTCSPPLTAQLAAGMYGFAGPDVLRRQLDLLLTGHDWLWGALGLGTRLLLRAQDALSPRTRPGRPDRLPRAQLRRRARRRAARPRGRLPRDRHRRRGFRGRAVRSRRGHAQLRVAHRGDLRRP